MRAMVVRQRLARSAAIAASVALLAACAKANAPAHGGPDGSGSVSSAAGYSAGMLLVSNGTNTVVIGDRKVTFSTTVTDAAWSPDGSRLAFVDGNGNIATARPDGSGLLVLTQHADGVVRSRPAWSGPLLIFAEKTGQGAWLLRQVAANASNTSYQQGEVQAWLGEAHAVDGNTDHTIDEGAGSSPSAKPDDRGNGKEVALQRQGAKGPEVWVADLNQRTPYQSKLADGSEPALSSDGSKVAYVDPNGQIKVVDPTTQNAKPVQITFRATSPSHLTWSPDGTHVAFQTPTEVQSVAADIPAGATANPSTQISATTGVPSYLRPQSDKVTRVTGADPVETSVAGSQLRWPTRKNAFQAQSDSGATGVVLAGTTNLPAMLAGAQMVEWGPLLFTSGATLDPRTAAEITRVLGAVQPDSFVPTVTILGGTDVVSAQAENAVKALGYATERVNGADPYTMAVVAAGKPADAKMVLVVDAADPAGYASAISDLGAYSQQTVLLTNGSTLPDGVKTFLNGIPKTTKVYAVGAGAQAALATSWSGRPSTLQVTPYVGANPGATTALLLKTYGGSAQHLVVVDKSSTTDLITAIGVARPYGAPVLVVDSKAGIDDATRAWLDASSASINDVIIVDSAGAISADFAHTLGALLCGPLGNTPQTNPKATATS